VRALVLVCATSLAVELSACNDAPVGGPRSALATTSPATAQEEASALATATSAVPAVSAPDASASASAPDALDTIPDEMLRRGLLVVVPRSLTKPSPLLIFLHPEGTSGPRFTHDLGVEVIAKMRGFAYATPDGARVSWQASSAAWGAGAPDARQDDELRAIITLAKRKPNIDPARIYAVGWGSGGFMAHHLACSVAGLRGVFSIGGAGPARTDPPCNPPNPVDVVEIHGDKDNRVDYSGGALDPKSLGSKAPLPPYPSAKETFEGWGDRLGCGPASASDALEIFSDLAPGETSVTARTGCRGGARVELWTVRGGTHAIATPHMVHAILNFIEPRGHE